MGKISMSQIAAMNISYQFYSIDFFLESVAKIGFSIIDIWTGYPHLLVEEGYEKEAERIRKRCDELGLKVNNVTPKAVGWPVNIADADEKMRKRAVAYMNRCVDAADILGAGSLQLIPGTGLYDKPVEPAWQRSRESLTAITEYAAQRGKTLVLEAIQIVESNLINNRDQLQRMLKEINHPSLGAVVDTTHMEKNGETLDQYFTAMGSLIKRVHLNESNQLPWGDGNSPIDTYLEHLNKHNYTGPFTVEICSRPHYLKPHETMLQSYEYLQAALARQK